jgi:hypothetical protein
MELTNEELKSLVEILNEQDKAARSAWNNREYRLVNNMRSRLHHAIKRGPGAKAPGTTNLIGCSVEHLISHLESKFDCNMTWDNYGEWHVDHIKPCAAFDLKDPQHQRECFHYSNLQPLWAQDNFKKSDNY